jgi:hypothetical protein
MGDNKLTSVKVKDDLFEEFKVLCVRTKFSLQKLVDRSIHMYLTDEDYRKTIHNHTNLSISGSQS